MTVDMDRRISGVNIVRGTHPYWDSNSIRVE